MLLQSYDGYIYILPALPDALPNGSVKGLKARGGFEIDIDWKQGQLAKLIVKSALGGNCRIRIAKGVQLSGTAKLLPAIGENKNEFYHVDKIKEALISENATLKGISVPPTLVYDFATTPGRDYIFVSPSQIK